jgi:hypothetical protein
MRGRGRESCDLGGGNAMGGWKVEAGRGHLISSHPIQKKNHTFVL